MIENYFTHEKTHKVWKPIEIPAMLPSQELMLVETMLGSDFYVFYNKTSIILPPYGLDFLTWIQKFYCGIVFHSMEYLGTTCTIDVVIMDPDNISNRKVIDSFSYTYGGEYEPKANWFNSKTGWYYQIPKDFQQATNCVMQDGDGESLSLPSPGNLEVDGTLLCEIQTNNLLGVLNYRKELVAEIAPGYIVHSWAQMTNLYYSSISPDNPPTLASWLFDDNGTTNLAALAKSGNHNELTVLYPAKSLSLSRDQPVRFNLFINSYNDYGFSAIYFVNDIPFCLPNGKYEVPIIAYNEDIKSGEKNKLRVDGAATVTQMYGNIYPIASGWKMLIN